MPIPSSGWNPEAIRQWEAGVQRARDQEPEDERNRIWVENWERQEAARRQQEAATRKPQGGSQSGGGNRK
ncbi:hypothetical protein MMC09_002511 [Bachmanniomyces sp. S44760]|nr:hypothetical protein [Bachmanniomyces sp. S44760]